MTNFKSVTEEVRGIILAELSDGKEHMRKELFGTVKEKTTQDGLTDGIFSGAIKLMMNSGLLIVSDRGVYQINAQNAQLSLEKKVYCILNETRNQLVKSCNVNILGFNQENITVVNKVNEIICYMVDAISYFETSGQMELKPEKAEPVVVKEEPEKAKVEPEKAKVEPEKAKAEPEKSEVKQEIKKENKTVKDMTGGGKATA